MKKRKHIFKKKPNHKVIDVKNEVREAKICRSNRSIAKGIESGDSKKIKTEKIDQKKELAMQITPLGDRVLVRPLEAGEKTKGGIILPDTAKEKPQEGKVVAVGKGKVLDDGKIQPLEVKAGDKILYGKYSGTEIKLGDEEHLIIREEDILAIIEN